MDVYRPGDEPRGWKTKAKELCRSVIADTPDGQWPAHDAEFVIDLLRMRTEPNTWAGKLRGQRIVNLIVRSEPILGKNRQFALVREDGSTVSVSWVNAVDAQWARDPASYRKGDVLGAMRRAIADQATEAIAAWRAGGVTRCEKCGAEGPLEADHYPVTFAELADQWSGGEWDDVSVVWSHDTWGSIMADPDGWREYHREHAGFRPLCSTCN